MTRIEVYDDTCIALERLADVNDTTIAEVVCALVEQFGNEVEV